MIKPLALSVIVALAALSQAQAGQWESETTIVCQSRGKSGGTIQFSAHQHTKNAREFSELNYAYSGTSTNLAMVKSKNAKGEETFSAPDLSSLVQQDTQLIGYRAHALIRTTVTEAKACMRQSNCDFKQLQTLMRPMINPSDLKRMNLNNEVLPAGQTGFYAQAVSAPVIVSQSEVAPTKEQEDFRGISKQTVFDQDFWTVIVDGYYAPSASKTSMRCLLSVTPDYNSDYEG